MVSIGIGAHSKGLNGVEEEMGGKVKEIGCLL